MINQGDFIKNYDYLIIDVTNLHFRAYYGDDKIQTMHKQVKLQTQGISGSLERINTYIKKYLKDSENGTIYFLFDDSNGGQRYESNYKADRKKQPKVFWRSLDFLESILYSYRDNSFILRSVETEADDWCKPIIKSLELLENDKKALLISTDLDWAGNMSEHVDWLSWYNHQVFDCDNFEKEYGFRPNEISLSFYKCFKGDKSDNIEGAYTQISPKKFTYVIENFKDMKGFLNGCRQQTIEVFNPAICKRMLREAHKLTMNWELVTFKDLSQKFLENNIARTKVNMLKLNQLYDSLAISGVDKRTISDKDVFDTMFEKQMVKRGR